MRDQTQVRSVMTKGYTIRVENSAPSQALPARSVVWAAPLLAGVGVRTVVDLGCGRLRNVRVLERHFSRITLVDTEFQCERIRNLVPRRDRLELVSIDEFLKEKSGYDAVFLIAVLHIVDRPSTRNTLLDIAGKKLRRSGFLVLDVPVGEHYYRMRCCRENRHGDGWVMGSGPVRTFYKSFNAEGLDRLVEGTGLFELYGKSAIDKHVVRIWRRV